MCGWCLAYCTGVVLNTVRESATSDSKKNKQADAGSRRFRRHFLCGALLCNFSSTEHEGLSTHVQRECSAESFMRSILSLKGRLLCIRKTYTKMDQILFFFRSEGLLMHTVLVCYVFDKLG